LKYEGESGALNEHISDVFGMMVTLWDEKKTSAESDWLIGEGCLKPGMKGIALRNMKFPGTAYDDPQVCNHEPGRLRSTAIPLQICAIQSQLTTALPQFGKDPQPASWAEVEAYKAKHKYWGSYDHGSVHAFSGVPNRAFVLASEALGGYSWEKAGKIWWMTLRTHRIPSTCSFVLFANATVDMARDLFDEEVAKVVRNAWDVVGVIKPMS
jgi:Zn-dependent metalloprotease